MLTAEKALGNYLKVFEKIGKLKLLVLDDLGPEVMTKEQRNLFLEIVEERYLTGSIIITSQLPFEQWYEVFGEPTVADAICDRLFHNAHKIPIEGDSIKKIAAHPAPCLFYHCVASLRLCQSGSNRNDLPDLAEYPHVEQNRY